MKAVANSNAIRFYPNRKKFFSFNNLPCDLGQGVSLAFLAWVFLSGCYSVVEQAIWIVGGLK